MCNPQNCACSQRTLRVAFFGVAGPFQDFAYRGPIASQTTGEIFKSVKGSEENMCVLHVLRRGYLK